MLVTVILSRAPRPAALDGVVAALLAMTVQYPVMASEAKPSRGRRTLAWAPELRPLRPPSAKPALRLG
jgi:hypothetical protein